MGLLPGVVDAGGKSNPPDWMRKTFHHDHMLTLDELPLLVQGNVAPNVRISEPADGLEVRGPDVQLSGFASDRNTNLKSVTLHALGGPWRNWFLRSDADVVKAFEPSTLLGEAKLRRTVAGHSPGAARRPASTTWWPWQRTPTAWWPARTWFA